MENNQSDNVTQHHYKRVSQKTIKPDTRHYGDFDDIVPPKTLYQSRKQAYKFGGRKTETNDWY